MSAGCSRFNESFIFELLLGYEARLSVELVRLIGIDLAHLEPCGLFAQVVGKVHERVVADLPQVVQDT